ncbi:hypothetical protein [Azospirillum halopraeferens]|uniref:hypothetical protein n=1 Tax=Azospirillum halopraeferens TaxID=34010 RepID=UPI000406BD4B|nr:hypothetical protein [Azospirillum halopraeferens]
MTGVRTLLIALGLAAAAVTGVLAAGEGTAPSPAFRQWPGECVADAPFMRRNHMDLLKHQRDDTVHGGIRPANHSLNACVTCHAVKGDDGHPVTVADSRHFCRTCHDTTAVRVDCFSCHTSTPGVAK